MTFIPTHVYSCSWSNEGGNTFFNLVDSVTDTTILGRCIGDLYSGDFSYYPHNSDELDWPLTVWDPDLHTIIDLGPFSTFVESNPELFI